MCSEPVTRTPFSGFNGAYFFRTDISPGISCSAMLISFRPHSARLMSLTLKSATFAGDVNDALIFYFRFSDYQIIRFRLLRGALQRGGLVGLFPRDAVHVVDLAEVTVVRGLGI